MRAVADKPENPPTKERDGVRLRPLRVDDAAALCAYVGDPVVTELTSYPAVAMPLVEAMIERSLGARGHERVAARKGRNSGVCRPFRAQDVWVDEFPGRWPGLTKGCTVGAKTGMPIVEPWPKTRQPASREGR